MSRPSLSICQILSRFDNPSTRYLLPKFADFVDGVTDRPTKKQVHQWRTDACRRIVMRDHRPKFTKFVGFNYTMFTRGDRRGDRSHDLSPRRSHCVNSALARPLTLTIFVALWKSVRDIRWRKFVLPEKWTKVHQNSLRPATQQYPCRGFMCNCCMQRAAIPACNNCRLPKVGKYSRGRSVAANDSVWWNHVT